MAEAKKCDRCGKLYERKWMQQTYPYPKIKIVDEISATNQRAYMDLEDLDLCDECKVSFFTWLKHKGE